MSTDLHTLSGAYAIDALSVEEAQRFDSHLEQCLACRDEVGELQEAAAEMGASEPLAPPSALRARILAAADQQSQLPPKVTRIEAVRRRWTSQVVAAAAAVVLVLGAGIGVLQSQRDDQSLVAESVQQVFDAPDAHTETFPTQNGGRVKVATSAKFGQMAVATKTLPMPPTKRAYQMWTIHNGRSTSVGLIEDIGTGKVMPMPVTGTTVAITIEPAGGSKQPTQEPIFAVDPESV